MTIDDNIIPPVHDLFGTTVRFTIMLVLYKHRKIKFTELQKLMNLTSGNLKHHLQRLVDYKYLEVYKAFSPTRLVTFIEITDNGKKAFGDYLIKFRHILNEININPNQTFVDMIVSSLYVLIPVLWLTVMGWAGIQAGTHVASMVGAMSAAASSSGDRAAGFAQKAISSIRFPR